MEESDKSDVCPKCHGLGRIIKADGSVNTCFDCLQNGKFEVHEKDLKDNKIRL
jgi:DnaJ-class molecular chaperone